MHHITEELLYVGKRYIRVLKEHIVKGVGEIVKLKIMHYKLPQATANTSPELINNLSE